jgi:hypothetical protein
MVVRISDCGFRIADSAIPIPQSAMGCGQSPRCELFPEVGRCSLNVHLIEIARQFDDPFREECSDQLDDISAPGVDLGL